MSLQSIFIASLVPLAAKEKSLLCAIANCCDNKEQFSYERQTLATLSGLSVELLRKTMKSFLDKGLLSVVDDESKGRYQLTLSSYLRHSNLEIRFDEHGKIIVEEPKVDANQQVLEALTLKQKYRIFNRDQFKCLSCYSTENLKLSFVIPPSKGGVDGIENIQTLCQVCEYKKGDEIRDYRVDTKQEEPVITKTDKVVLSTNQHDLLIPLDRVVFDYELYRIAELVGFNGDVDAQWHKFVGHYMANGASNNDAIKTRIEWQGLWRKWIASSKGYQKDFLIAKDRQKTLKTTRQQRREQKNSSSNAADFDEDVWDMS